MAMASTSSAADDVMVLTAPSSSHASTSGGLSWPVPDPAVVAQTVRPARVVSFDGVSQDVLDYAAGLVDADGELQIYSVAVSQAQKGVACLHFMHDHFGGRVVALPHKDGENHQQAYEWQIFGEGAPCEFARRIVGSLLLKKREALVLIEYGGLHKRAKAARDAACERIKALKHVPHDSVPESVKPTDAYFGGFVDGEGCLDTHGQTSQHHTISQSHRPICDVLERRFGGTTCWSAARRAYYWSIHTFADKFLKTIAPYVVGKRAQVHLILAMKPGEAMDVHCQLRELKGNIGRATPKIDRHLAGNGRVYVRPPKVLPMGVHNSNGGKFTAMLGHNSKSHQLGTFDTVEEALAQYEKHKVLVEASKRDGTVVDLEFNTRKRRKNPPPPAGQVLPLGIYPTAANTYQARYHGGGKVVQLGTHKTLELAVAARNAYLGVTSASTSTSAPPNEPPGEDDEDDEEDEEELEEESEEESEEDEQVIEPHPSPGEPPAPPPSSEGTVEPMEFAEPLSAPEDVAKPTLTPPTDEPTDEPTDVEPTDAAPPGPTTTLPNDPRDYVKFVRDCFDLVEGTRTTLVEMRARYILWRRSTEVASRAYDGLLEHLSAHHGHRRSHVEFDPETNVTQIVIRGLSMRPLPAFVASEGATNFDRFFAERCVTKVTGRIATKDLNDEFVAWMRLREPEYVLTTGDKHDRCHRMSETCLYNAGTGGAGYYGAAIRGHVTENSGPKRKDGNRKSVQELDPTTGVELRRFASMGEAAKDADVAINKMSVAIAAGGMLKGRVFRKC